MRLARGLLVLGSIAALAYLLRRWFVSGIGEDDVFPAPSANPAPGLDSEERRSEPDPEALAESVAPTDRIGFDLERLRHRYPQYEPLVEHLSYIQVKRGESETLLFVRRRDLDALAALTGLSKDSFVEEFKEMGVLLSMN